MKRLKILFLLTLCFCFLPDQKPSFAADKEVLLLSYYKDPPFVVGDGEGLVFDFVEILNRHSGGKYEFSLQFLPRKRLDKFLYFGGVLGRKYKGLEESFAAGSIYRSDAPNAESVLRMLLRGRVDVVTAPPPS